MNKLLNLNENTTIQLQGYNGGINKSQSSYKMYLIILDPKEKYILVVVKDVFWFLGVCNTILLATNLCKKGCKFSLDDNGIDWILFTSASLI